MPPAETAGAKIRANCGVEVRASPVLLDIRGCNRQTNLPKRVTTFCLFRFPSHFPPRSVVSLLTFVIVRCILTAPVFAVSITYFCRDVCGIAFRPRDIEKNLSFIYLRDIAVFTFSRFSFLSLFIKFFSIDKILFLLKNLRAITSNYVS